MKNKLIVLSGSLLGFMFPVAAFAQQSSPVCEDGKITGIICKIGDILNLIIPILITLAILYFIWGIITFVISDDEEAKSRGRDRIIYGVIGLAVIIAVWGLVRLLLNTFNIQDNSQVDPGSITFPNVNY